MCGKFLIMVSCFLSFSHQETKILQTDFMKSWKNYGMLTPVFDSWSYLQDPLMQTVATTPHSPHKKVNNPVSLTVKLFL